MIHINPYHYHYFMFFPNSVSLGSSAIVKVPEQVGEAKIPRRKVPNFPEGVPKQGSQARFPSNAPTKWSPSKVPRKRSPSKVAKNRFPSKVPRNRFPSKVPRKRFPSKVPRKRFPGRGSQATFPGTGSQPRLPRIGSQARFPGRGSQAGFPGRGSQAGFPGSQEEVRKQGSQEQVPTKVPRFPEIPVPKQGFQEQVSKQGSSSKVSKPGSQARFQSQVPGKVPEQGFQEQVPKGLQASFPGTGSQRFPKVPRSMFPSKVPRPKLGFQGQVSKNRFPGTCFQEQVSRNSFPSDVTKQGFRSKATRNRFARSSGTGVHAMFLLSPRDGQKEVYLGLSQTAFKHHSDKLLLTFSCSCCPWGYSLGLFFSAKER